MSESSSSIKYSRDNISAKLGAMDSLADIEDKLNDSNTSTSKMYNRPGTFFSNADVWNSFGNAILNESFRSSGIGPQQNIMQNFLSRLDRHGNTYAPTNTMNYGYTFITRPRFNMTTGNLLQHPVTALLSTGNGIANNSVSFMIRMLMDTRLCSGAKVLGSETTPEESALAAAAEKSGLLDINNPFFTPLCNGLRGISGWPDFNLETATMGEDFHSGDFTFVKGSDMLIRTTELSLEFTDVQGSIILSCIFYWCLMMALQAKGVIQAYPDDIYEQRLNYTVSIYRFITDATRRNILWWSKATGCFPKSAPIGQLFNVNQGEVTISSAKQFSIPFTANVIEYNNPSILFDFRQLMRNYVGDDFDNVNIWPLIPNEPITQRTLPNWNYIGLPDIIDNSSMLELVWKTNKDKYSDNWPTGEYIENKSIIDKTASVLIEDQDTKLDAGINLLNNESLVDKTTYDRIKEQNNKLNAGINLLNNKR